MFQKIIFKKRSKAQISLEVLVVVLLLIVFTHMYSQMSENTFNTLEISKIKESHQSIALNLNSFLLDQKGILDLNNNNYNISFDYKIPAIEMPDNKVNCTIDVNSTTISVYTPKYNGVITNFATNLGADNFVFPKTFYCGQKINCKKDSLKINCS